VTKKFILKAPFKPTGDQPQAIKGLMSGLERGHKKQTLLGVTGSGKTFTLANIIAQSQKPALVISHNKTLAAQLTEEFKSFFPTNSVNYFVSYYDYYQPEAYLAPTDTYIAKDASINEEIDRLRHATIKNVLTRQDIIVVASVSCIYGIGAPVDYFDLKIELTQGQHLSRQELLNQLTSLHYTRNDIDLIRGTYRVRGDIVDIHPTSEDSIIRIEFLGPKIDHLSYIDELTGETQNAPKEVHIFPATLFMTTSEQQASALTTIRQELTEQLKRLDKQNKKLEAQRLQQRTNYDLEMIEQIGYVSGIENYSRHFEGRKEGTPPTTLLDYFTHAFGQNNFLTLIDESHMTIPQISGMYAGDRARKNNLVEHGFRLPSARDNRPLQFHEFEDRIGPTIFTSATPADYEENTSQQTVEQLMRPTGLLDPTIDIRPIKHQTDDVINEIQERIKNKQRVLVTTLTKRMSEDLSTYLIEIGIKAAYLHSDVETLERIEILRNLRLGTYDVLVGINLLREGLDLPEVSLVAIMDADKEGFLRSETSLIQTMGRAARHVQGHIIMYADRTTRSMQKAIDETTRRRLLQKKYNEQHSITPRSIEKEIQQSSLSTKTPVEEKEIDMSNVPPDEIRRAIKHLTSKMNLASKNLEFEKATQLRDAIVKIQQHKQ
jgi:excinuclease ABC subunit B